MLYGIDWIDHQSQTNQTNQKAEISLSHLKRQLAIDGHNQFAINYLLFIFFKHDGAQWVVKGDDDARIDGNYLNQIFIALKENKRLRSRYKNLIPSLNKLLTSNNLPISQKLLFDLKPTPCFKVDFYRLQSSQEPTSEAIIAQLKHLTTSDYSKARLEVLQNYLQYVGGQTH